MRIVELHERSVPLSRYADPALPSGGLNTSMVAVVTDVMRAGRPVVGFGFASFGRFAQGGLIRERFAPRLLIAPDEELVNKSGDNLDPVRAWQCMMRGEKPGGHGERCVAVGTIDMAIWDAAAKIADEPLHQFLARSVRRSVPGKSVPVYAGGGYYYPSNDIHRLMDEIRQFLDQGYTRVKIKVGGRKLSEDRARIEAVLSLLPAGDRLAVDAMNSYSPHDAIAAAKELTPYGLAWFEDVCDPLDYQTHAEIASTCPTPLGAGEALFALAEARNLVCYGGLRPDRDVLLFDPVHCYGLAEYLRIVAMLEENGWNRSALQPHGGHLFALHVASALDLGGCEANPLSFQPFGGFSDGYKVTSGKISPPQTPGIGFETRRSLVELLQSTRTL
jgi:L-alanine-DL-glutamate epimerase-like enolase superfamily enzyme